jgi:hypothetical protein
MIRSLAVLFLLTWPAVTHGQSVCALPRRAGASGTTSASAGFTARLSVGLVAGAASAGQYVFSVGLQNASLGGYACFLSTNTPLSVAALPGSHSTQRLVATTGPDMTLEWTPSDDPLSVTYAVYAGTDPASMPLITSGLTGTTYELTSLTYLALYYWQIIVTDSFGRSTPSAVYSFSIAPYQDHMIAAPNPFHPGQGTTFMFTMSGPGSASLEIYSLPDIRRVFSTHLDGLQDGVNIYAYDGRDSGGRLLPNGVFSVRLIKSGSTGGGIERFKIISVR